MATRKPPRKSKSFKPDDRPRAGGDLVPAAEYARRIGVTKPQMSAWFHRGLPFIDGKDAEGRRDCKLVVLAEADAWRMANTDVRVKASGELSGLNMASDPSGSVSQKAQSAPATGEGVPSKPVIKGAAGGEAAPPPQGSSQAPADLTPQQLATARIAEAKARASEMDTESKSIGLAQKQGALVDRASAIEIVVGFAQGAAAILDRKPGERATHLANDLGVTPHQAMLAMRRITDELQAELAKLAGNIARDLEGVGR